MVKTEGQPIIQNNSLYRYTGLYEWRLRQRYEMGFVFIDVSVVLPFGMVSPSYLPSKCSCTRVIGKEVKGLPKIKVSATF